MAWANEIKVVTNDDGTVMEWRVNMKVNFIVKDGAVAPRAATKTTVAGAARRTPCGTVQGWGGAVRFFSRLAPQQDRN